MSHEPTKLDVVATFNRKMGRGQRKFNVWYVYLRCPACGREFKRLQNTMRGRHWRYLFSVGPGPVPHF